MELKDSAAISYLAEPEVLAVSVLKNGAKGILQSLADLGIIAINKTQKSLTEFAQGNYCEILQKLNGSIEDDSFVEQQDFPLENNLSREIL